MVQTTKYYIGMNEYHLTRNGTSEITTESKETVLASFLQIVSHFG